MSLRQFYSFTVLLLEILHAAAESRASTLNIRVLASKSPPLKRRATAAVHAFLSLDSQGEGVAAA